ncbi:MAG TPA: HD domain-containing phosphohydrolase [Candidatus Acidoferrum sp.]|nr:HD domain-containing phosphohydrolase [Candidatus Acidoferrum sp.]
MAVTDKVLEFLEFMEAQGKQSVAALLDSLLHKSRDMTNAEAGTIFILHATHGKRRLKPVCVQNDAVKVRKTNFDVPVGKGTIAGHVASTGDILLLNDVYAIPPGRDYSFDASFERPDYRTRSMLCFPLRNYQDRIIGVIQLINCRPDRRKAPVAFPRDIVKLVTPIARVAGGSIERALMLDRIEQKNEALRERNRLLAAQRQQITDLQHDTEEAFQVSIRLLARAAEIHDEETGQHIVRVNEYSYELARLAGMSEAWCDEIRYSAQLHDVGKMSIDAAILKKKGPLTAEERKEMDRHTVYGYQILSASSRMTMGAEIAYYHHEKWDGTGYPVGLKGEAIPISARIVQIADIYDALRSERPYKRGFTHEEAVRILTEGDERIDPKSHYDPRLLQLFTDNHKQFAAIWDRLHD